jgi:hypothetical protein
LWRFDCLCFVPGFYRLPFGQELSRIDNGKGIIKVTMPSALGSICFLGVSANHPPVLTCLPLCALQKRPPWLAVKSLDDLKTKLGHVIVMILLVGMFEKSKIVHPTCSMDLFLTAGAVLLCAGSLFLLNRLKPEGKQGTGSAPLH